LAVSVIIVSFLLLSAYAAAKAITDDGLSWRLIFLGFVFGAWSVIEFFAVIYLKKYKVLGLSSDEKSRTFGK
jgi:hypothetical protein